MKKNVILVVLSGVIAVLPIGKASGFGTTLFFDDFESYSIGTFPSTGSWEIVWAGTGENYVTDAYSYSPTKSLQLWGRPNWASVAQRKFSTDAPVIGYEFAIRIDSIGTGGPGRVEHPGFFSREAYIWGAYYARVIFNHDTGKIEAEDGSILGQWVPGVWYQVKVALDRNINTYSVWIQGQLKGEGLTTTRSDTHLIDALALISAHPGVKVYYDDANVDYDDANVAQWNIDFQGDENHNNTYGQTDPVDYTEWGVYWNIFEVPALSAPWPGPTNYATNPSMDLADDEGSFGVGKSSLVKFSIVGDAYGWAGGAGSDPLTGDYLIILNSFGVTNDPLTWRIIGLAPGTTYRLTYYHLANVFGRGINFVANGVETTVSVPGLSVASALVTTGWGGRITGTADSNGYYEGDWSALTIGTVAATATNPHPADGATNVPLDVVLSWSPPDYAVSHDVYFGTSSPPAFIGNLAASSYDPGTLEPGTTYYWKIDGVEADGTTKHTGDLWSFTTQHIVVPLRCEASNPDPADGATRVPLDVVLSWTPGHIWPFEGTRFQDVYFGTNFGDVNNANTKTAGVYKGRQPRKNTSYDPGGLESSKEYYWRIDMVNVIDWVATVLCKGDVWSFTTGVKPDYPKYPDVTAGLAWAPVALEATEALIWTPTNVFQQTTVLPTAEEVTVAGSSISNVQGIVWSPVALGATEALIWTPDKVYRKFGPTNTAKELKDDSTKVSISDVRGIVWAPVALGATEALIWTGRQVFRHIRSDPNANAEEVTVGGSSISNVQGIAWSPVALGATEALIWTPDNVYRKFGAVDTATELKEDGAASIAGVQGIVWAPVALGGTEALIWNSGRVFRKFGALDTATELKEDGAASIAGVQGIVWAPVALGGTEALIWNSGRVFRKFGAIDTATELKEDGAASIAGVQGIVWAPVALGGTEALIWNSGRVFRKFGAIDTATELKEDGAASIAGVQGIVWAPVALGGTEALIWNSGRVFRKFGALDTATELKEDGAASIAGVQGIVWAPVALGGTEALIWNSGRVFRKFGAIDTATELKEDDTASIAGVQGIVWAPVALGSTEALILTPGKVFCKFAPPDSATELKENGTTSIFSYDPALVSTVQAVIHHQGVIIVTDEFVFFVGPSGAGIVGKPATTPVAYTGSSTAAVVVSWSTSPSFHSTVLGAAPFINTAMILGPEPVAGVVAGNSMRLFGFYSP